MKMTFRPVTHARKMNAHQIASLSSKETANVITIAKSSGPVSLVRANVGTSIRPEMAVILNGVETVESFLARGGTITVGKPETVKTATVRVKGTRQTAKPFVMGNVRNKR